MSRKALFEASPSRCAEETPPSRVPHEFGQALAQVADVSRPQEIAGLSVDHEFGNAVDPARQDRQRRRHRLDDGERHRLERRGQREKIEGAHQPRRILAMAEPLQTPRARQRLPQRMQAALFLAIADDDQLPGREREIIEKSA